MQNIFSKEKIIAFKDLVKGSSQISIITHTNPDGDAVGSASALRMILKKQHPEKQIRAFVPNAYPDFLGWIAESSGLEICTPSDCEKKNYIRSCELIILSDLNSINRTDHLAEIIKGNSNCKITLIDHHESPMETDITFQHSKSSSTCFLAFNMIKKMEMDEFIDPYIASALYAGIVTDTGSFSYSYLTPELFSSAGELVAKGADPVTIHQRIYDTQSEDRIRLFGHLINQKMVIIVDKHAAYVTLTNQEKETFNYKPGDTEGVVNYPMSIKEINASAFFSESNDYIKVSLRSQGNTINVDKIAKEYFNGGGHFNAAGGKFFGSLDEAVATYKKALETL